MFNRNAFAVVVSVWCLNFTCLAGEPFGNMAISNRELQFLGFNKYNRIQFIGGTNPNDLWNVAVKGKETVELYASTGNTPLCVNASSNKIHLGASTDKATVWDLEVSEKSVNFSHGAFKAKVSLDIDGKKRYLGYDKEGNVTLTEEGSYLTFGFWGK